MPSAGIDNGSYGKMTPRQRERGTTKEFSFNRVIEGDCGQQEFFQASGVKSMLDAALQVRAYPAHARIPGDCPATLCPATLPAYPAIAHA